jgi:hypothetical protein
MANNKKLTAMKDLKNKYYALKRQAIELMQEGNIKAYLAKLQEVNDLRFQMIQLASGH